MEDIFSLEPEQPVTMSSREFFEKTKSLLEKIINEYSSCWHTRSLKESEYPEESVCDQCKGCGLFKDAYGIELECYQDNGDCYHRYLDAEEFGLEVEANTESIYELLCVDEITS